LAASIAANPCPIAMPRTCRARCGNGARNEQSERFSLSVSMAHGVQVEARMGAKAETKTNVLELLTSQHAELDALIGKIERGKDARAAFQEMADKLAAHATIEEKIFYPAVMSEKLDDLLHESVEEHLEIKRVLADMLMLDIGSDRFMAKLTVLKENLSHHAHEEEEDKMFPMLRRSMAEDELVAIGNRCLVMFEDLLPQHPSRNVPNETKKAAVLPQPR
jgi:hemerythrin superfamily protein